MIDLTLVLSDSVVIFENKQLKPQSSCVKHQMHVLGGYS